MQNQKTLKFPVEIEGPALWSGEWSRVTIHPAEPGEGFVFMRVDTGKPVRFKASVESAALSLRRVVLKNSGYELAFVEHLLAALWGMGIDNARVEVDASELPFLDGSALPYVSRFLQTGLVDQGVPRKVFKPTGALVVFHNGRLIAIRPAARLGIGYVFFHRGIKVSRFIDIEDVFPTLIAPARTFARGVYPSFDYPFGIRHSGVLSFPYPTRFQDEMSRHKILDLVGDLALMGIRPLVHIWAYGTGHKENHKAIRLITKEVLNERNGHRRN